MLSPLPTQLNPRSALAWVASNHESITSVVNAGSQESKLELCATVTAKVLPMLDKGSEILKKQGKPDDFEESLDQCRKLLDYCGCDAAQAGVPTEDASTALGRLLACKTPIDADGARADLASLHELLASDALQSPSDAELVLQRLQAHAKTLRAASQDAVDLGDDDGYAEPAASAKSLAGQLQAQLRQTTWRPFKLQDEVNAAHGSLIRSVDRLYDEYGDDFKERRLHPNPNPNPNPNPSPYPSPYPNPNEVLHATLTLTLTLAPTLTLSLKPAELDAAKLLHWTGRHKPWLPGGMYVEQP